MERQCRICGKSYKTCYTCEKKRSWRTVTDTEEHYYMLVILMEYKADRDAAKAIAAFNAHGIRIGDYDEYIPCVAELLKEIYEA